ncbi:hypothetical protein RvY_03948 [Ramazzottius varieornatus]|uniref:C-CAP/cofactor C-like domain-containing protein n=1 Tax=Ramazzottius varieornatus TaxID=947166 RepID=A0A1D1UVI6_RAMVA|nr:hypothetical protein RvY_03948 [Ramazzottius varieornatus]
MEQNGKPAADDQHRVVVMDDLSQPSKRTVVSHVVQSVKDELTQIEISLKELSSLDLTMDKREVMCQDASKKLQDLERTFGDAAEYLPAFEQRLLQSRLSSASRTLAEKRSVMAADKGFSFRRNLSKARPIVDQKIGSLDQVDKSALLISPDMELRGDIRQDEKKLKWSNQADEVTRLDRVALKDKDVLLSKLHSCRIFLEGPCSTLQLKDLTNCTVISGPVRTSVFVTACSQCTFSVACQQVRIHESHHLKVYQQSSGCIIEDTTDCQFGPYNVTYPRIEEDFKEAGLSREENERWKKVEDFNYIVANKPSPNWKIIPEDEREQFNEFFFI